MLDDEKRGGGRHQDQTENERKRCKMIAKTPGEKKRKYDAK